MQDEGLSASTGENLAKGELGRFLAEVREGSIPSGSVLYLDEPTRLTRLNPSKAMRIIADLEDAGVSIRLSARGQTLAGDSLYELLGFLIESAAGHAFTRELGRKVQEAWKARREQVRKTPGQEVLSSNTPFGIAVVGGTYAAGKGWIGRRYEPHPDEAKVVVLIFELARDGHSPGSIAKILNEKSIPSPHGFRGRKCKTGRAVWRTEVVRDILQNRAYVDGSYQPFRCPSKKERIADGEPIIGHYPAILDQSLWAAANAELQRRPGRVITHHAGASNLFTGLMTCAHCGGAISLRSGKGRGRIPAMFCINARVGVCTVTQTVHRWKIEAGILAKLHYWLSPETILSDLNRAHAVVDRDATLQRLRNEVRERDHEVAKMADRVLALADSSNIDLFEERLTKAREEVDELRVKLVTAERDRTLAEAEVSQSVRAATDFRGLVYMAVYGEPRAEICGPIEDIHAAFRDIGRLESELGDKVDHARVKLKAALRRLVVAITLDVESGDFAITLQSGAALRGDTEAGGDLLGDG